MAVFKLFFSNKSADQEKVEELKSKLRDLLPNLPFKDVSEEIPHCDDWQKIALPLLESCDALVCVAGETTHESGNVEWEIREAHQFKKPLLITRLSEDHKTPPCCDEFRILPVDWDAARVAGQIGELLISRALFNRDGGEQGAPSPDAIWNQYNLMVQSWEALINRRQTVNTLYQSATAALLAGIGAVISSLDKTGMVAGGVAVLFLSVLGAGLSLNWRRTILSYGTLSRAKSKVIAALEAHMPARLFDAEWTVLEAKQYKSTTETDQQTAWFFCASFMLILFLALGFTIAQAVSQS